jgi:proline dehydrogenase
MSFMRNMLLAASKNQWMGQHIPRYRFVRRTVSRFMPGEALDDALSVAQELKLVNIGTVLTRLGENVTVNTEALETTRHYLGALERIRPLGLDIEISVKLTQLGLDLSAEACYDNLRTLVESADPGSIVWIDMEGSKYVDSTLELFRRARAAYSNVGVCLQAYLYRTRADLEALLPLGPAVRLTKGAYNEPPGVAFPAKRSVDQNYFALAQQMLSPAARQAGSRAAFATHDRRLIQRISEFAAGSGLRRDDYEFQMLYGIQREEQLRLARDGYRSRVLISYGPHWYPWFMRRLAERPANVTFVLRNLISA